MKRCVGIFKRIFKTGMQFIHLYHRVKKVILNPLQHLLQENTCWQGLETKELKEQAGLPDYGSIKLEQKKIVIKYCVLLNYAMSKKHLSKHHCHSNALRSPIHLLISGREILL